MEKGEVWRVGEMRERKIFLKLHIHFYVKIVTLSFPPFFNADSISFSTISTRECFEFSRCRLENKKGKMQFTFALPPFFITIATII